MTSPINTIRVDETGLARDTATDLYTPEGAAMYLASKYSDVECPCSGCRAACARPCWPTPEEAAGLIASGFADRLMLDWWACGDSPNVEILCPANPGHEGKRAPGLEGSVLGFMLGTPSALESGCVLQNAQGLCIIHHLRGSNGKRLKPTEGRFSTHSIDALGLDRSYLILHRCVASLWQTPEAKALIETWKKGVNFVD